MARVEPLPEVRSAEDGIRAREAARRKAEPPGLGPYCFLKAFVGSHGRATTPFALSLSKGCLCFLWEKQCFDKLSTNGLMRAQRFRPSSSSRISVRPARSAGSA